MLAKNMNKFFITLLVFLASCVPQAQNPTASPNEYAKQKFTTDCLVKNFTAENCDTYVFSPDVLVEAIEVRISGQNLQLNSDNCINLPEFEIGNETYQRLRCVYKGTDKNLYLYLNGKDLRIITQYTFQEKFYYLPPVGN